MVTKRDYNAEQVAAARSVLLELMLVLGEYREHMVVVGGWVPELLITQPSEPHIGSIDVDLAVDHRAITEAGYRTIRQLLVDRGYEQDDQQPFIFRRGVNSMPWNPIIANVFYRAGIIERWGTGTLNIIDWCAENGNPAPTWQEQAGSVYVTFLPAALPDTLQVTGKVAGEVTGEVAGEVRRLLEVLGTNTLTRSQSQTALGLKGQAQFGTAIFNLLLKRDLSR